jgi:hypothetical protein
MIVGLFGFLRRSNKPDLDAMVLEHLKKAGSDLSKPHRIDFFLYLRSQRAAEEAAQRVKGEGFDAEVTPPVKSSDWLCHATKLMVPDLGALQEIRSDFKRLAASLGGDYDGWGTEVEK